jgi:hypothetical protein
MFRGRRPAALDRRCRFGRGFHNGRYRRFSPIATHSGDRLLSEPIAGAHPWRREPLFMFTNLAFQSTVRSTSWSAGTTGLVGHV